MKDETGKVVFDADEQEKVDEIVKERLSRHKPDDYDDLKEVYEDIGEFFVGETIAEKKANIKALKEAQKQQTEENLEQEVEEYVDEEEDIPDDKVLVSLARKFGTTTEKVERLFKNQLEEASKEETDKLLKEDWEKQQVDFKESYPDTDVPQLKADKDFMKFANKRVGTLKEIYEDYSDYTAEHDQKTADEIRAKYKSKDLLSTGTGKGTAGDNSGLTEQEKETLEAWNRQNPKLKMSATEFKNKL